MVVNIYYRGMNKQLHGVKVEGVDSVQDALEAVEDDLYENGEFFYEPILACITGGKA